MAIKKLKIKGLRGFSEETNIHFAIPDNKTPGSGLTVLVGPNNGGKSTIIEAVHLLTDNTDIIPLTSRNIKNKGEMEIEVEDIVGNTLSLQTTENKGAFVQRKYNNQIVEHSNNNLNTFILSAKRGFSSTFHNNNYQTRENYRGNISQSDYRSENNFNTNFGGRLLTIYKNRKKFDECLEKVLSPLPEWTIESSNDNELYLEFSFNEIKHSSKGAGDGYINIFNIVDSLYDSTEDNVILIDEPEISLHPDLQRKLFSLLIEYSKDKQIIISTHSPYFVDWKLFSESSKIIRVKKVNESIKVFELKYTTRKDIKKIINDAHNPHILSLNANEIFFLNDNVVLTEGQDDVLCYTEIFKKYNYKCEASFFGWGAGGADKIKIILNILDDLGYEKVFTILDNDKRSMIPELKNAYSKYEFYAIITDDVRNKKRNNNIDTIIEKINNLDDDKKDEIIEFIDLKFRNVKGLVSSMSTYEINNEYNEDIINLIKEISKYFSKEESSISKIENKEETKSSEQDTYDKSLAQKMLHKWIKEENVLKKSLKKYKKFDFHYGGGCELGFKKIKEHTYYAIIEQTDNISKNYYITIDYHIIINTQKNIVRLKRKHIVANTLPISKLFKFLEKVFS